MPGSSRVLLALALLLAAPASASAAAGQLDPAFSQDGKVSLVAAGSFVVRAVAVQPDGRILAGGYTCEPGPSRNGLCTADGDSSFRIARFTADGGLDPEWGDRGIVTTHVGTGRSQVFDLLPQPDGGVLAGGVARRDDGPDGFALARYDDHGALTRVTFTRVGTGFSAIADLAPAPGGAVVAVGQAVDVAGHDRIAIARYDASGLPDGGFGAFGTVLAGATGYGYGLGGWVTPSGAVMAAGIAGTSATDVGTHRTGVVRVTAGGGADPGFSGDGAAEFAVGSSSSFANALTGLPDGRWLTAGAATDPEGRQVMALVRGTPDGALDPGWDGDGVALVRTLAGTVAADVAPLGDGRVLAAGQAATGTGEVAFAVARLDPTGRLDPTFGGGIVTTRWERFPVARGTALAVDAGGRAIVAGLGCSDGTGPACEGGTVNLAMARYQGDAAPGADARSPVVAMIPFPRAYRRRTLVRRGLLVRVRPDEVARLTVSLRVRRGRRTATVARRSLPFEDGRRSLRVRVRARQLPRGPFTLRVVMRFSDRAGNMAFLRRAVRVR
jgi:uncharacterized delta-60 repeat protein